MLELVPDMLELTKLVHRIETRRARAPGPRRILKDESLPSKTTQNFTQTTITSSKTNFKRKN